MFMVNGGGDVIAHSDSRRVLAAAGYANLPIVRLMFKSKVDNGQTRYSDEKGRYYLGSFKKIGVAGAGVIATVSEDTALAAVYGIQRRNIYLMVIVLNVAVLIIYYFARTLSAPILSLVNAAQTIRDGDFNVGIQPTTRDEIGELTEAFIEMGRGLQEREKIKEAFGKFVHREIAERAMRDEIKLGGERKDVAILFLDIRDFTALAEKMQPEEIVGFLNGYLTRMVECVNKTHGMVDKFIGDAVMGVWGALVSTGNDAENAVNSALLMRQVLREFNKTRGRPGRPKIQIGMGINAGTVVAGQIGSLNRMEYTVIGDAVNLASRIEALNKPFGTDILISEDAHRKVSGIFDVVGMQKITVKGKEKHQQVYAVLGRRDDAGRPKSIEELRSLLGTKAKGETADVISFDEEKYEILAR
jgi:adenylate cyclase